MFLSELRARYWWLAALSAALPLSLAACSRDEQSPTSTFYSRKVGPVLEQSCATSSTRSRCHVVADAQGNALGNLSVESFEHLSYRRDLLLNYGPYGMPGLLLKVVPNFTLSLTDYKGGPPTLITTDIAHAGERLVDFGSPTFNLISRWMENGASENNAPQPERNAEQRPCNTALGSGSEFDASVDPSSADFQIFRDQVNPVLGESCAAGNCHGSRSNTLYLTCGSSPEQVRWNYFAASDFTSRDPGSSDIARRALAPSAGGTYHEGGTVFPSTADLGYQVILKWAEQKGGPTRIPSEPGFEFFASRVQPMLVKRGCMMLGCHSAAMFHDYRLRGGSGGHFGLPATRLNYELSLLQLALESPNPNASRLIAKNLPPERGGILHRGGALFAREGVAQACDATRAESGPLDEQTPYCVISAWIAKERAARMASAVPFSGIVYVKRAASPGPDTPQDWERSTVAGDVVRVAATLGADGTVTLGAETSLSRQCGLDPATSQARRPAVSWDGQRIAFSARSGATAAYRIYVVDGTNCEVEAAIDRAPVDSSGAPVALNGELSHNLDPAFAPDGRIVFVSTRGNLQSARPTGPRRTPADPSKLDTNLYVRESDGRIRQLTYLLNQEMLPSFMRDGRVILTTEKRTLGFYQLAGRRINLDGGDYHPLFAQRKSIGFQQFTSVVELPNKNLVAIASERGAAHGAGALALVNRSIGIDQGSSDPKDYLVDPSAITFPNPDFFQHSLSFIDPAATGQLSGTRGAYFAPSAFVDGRILVSHAPDVTNLGEFSGNFDVVLVDPSRPAAAPVPLITGPEDALWPVAIYARQNAGIFSSRLDEANGASEIHTELGDRAEITYMDLPLLGSLLFQNTRSGRRISEGPQTFQLWESLPPEPGVTSFANAGAFVTRDQDGEVYVRRGLLGALQPYADGSAKVSLPGGVPFVVAGQFQLAEDAAPTQRFQREEMQVYPGERGRQSFQRRFFEGMCGGCHGSVSGQEYQVAVNPDILTQASEVAAKDAPAIVVEQTGNVLGPEFP
ncbi:MAG TPA: hypothetical protein VFQ61_21925 [Polyangiaceae bacterium]|nr:hypothetical protein [Polyangiaceae bacterium]